MKTRVLAALAAAGAFCAPCLAQDMAPQKGDVFAELLSEDADLLQPAMTLLAQVPPQRGPSLDFEAPGDAPGMAPDFAGLPPPADMESGELVARMPGDRGQGFFGGQGQGPMMQGQMGGQRGFGMMGRHGFNQWQGPQGGCPMMQGQMGGQRGFGMMRQGQGQRPGMKGGMDKGSLEAQLAIDDPAKFEELKKLKEQQEKILKEYADKRKADREEFKKLLDAYKSKPSDELKAKIREKVATQVEARLKARELRLEKAKGELAKEKDGRDTKIDEMLLKITSKAKDDGKPQPKPQ